MPLWNRLKSELDRAGRVAQDALDEGKVRLDAFRARQQADKAAQALGYAVYRARQESRELEPETYERLSSALAAREAEAALLEQKLEGLTQERRGRKSSPGTPPPDTSTADAAPPPPNV